MQNQIPNNWQKVKLGDIFEMKYGVGLVAKNREIGKFPIYGSSGIIDFNIRPLTNKEGLIVGRKGNVGSVFYSNKPFFPIDTVYYIDTLKIPGNLKFVYYLLKKIPFKRIGSDVGVPGLNRDLAYGLETVIPNDPQEQLKIASILSSFDDKIELNNKIAKTLEDMTSTIFKEWFVKSNIKFRKGNIDELMKVKHGFAFPSKKFKTKGEIPVIKIKNILEDRSINTNNVDFINKNDFKDLINFKINNGDILIALTGATSGKIGILIGTYNVYLLNQRVGKFAFNKNYYKWFCYIFLTQSSYRNLLLNSSNGSAQGNLSPNQIESIEINIPSDELLEKFNNIVNFFYEKIIKSKLENQQLAQMRDLLLPKLMKGEIRV